MQRKILSVYSTKVHKLLQLKSLKLFIKFETISLFRICNLAFTGQRKFSYNVLTLIDYSCAKSPIGCSDFDHMYAV